MGSKKPIQETKTIAKIYLTLSEMSAEDKLESGSSEGHRFEAQVEASGEHIRHMLETMCEGDENLERIFMEVSMGIAIKGMISKMKGEKKSKREEPKAGPKEKMLKDLMQMLDITPGE